MTSLLFLVKLKLQDKEGKVEVLSCCTCIACSQEVGAAAAVIASGAKALPSGSASPKALPVLLSAAKSAVGKSSSGSFPSQGWVYSCPGKSQVSCK